MRIGIDVLIEMAKLHWRQVLRSDELPQRAEIIVGYNNVTAWISWRTGIATTALAGGLKLAL